MKISEKEYENKVLGCWLGKCIGGNIGAPYEGMKQRMNLSYSPEFLANMLPNDDLDLQVLWLDVLEKKGKHVTAADYAVAFNENCDYAPGEYAFFKKNYRKGIMPPLSGSFNNEYFNEGMGAPIRSELWACLFPQDAAEAVRYAAMDASADHRADGDSAHGEMFLSALESLAFGGGDMPTLIGQALAYIPAEAKLHRAIADVLRWHREKPDVNAILDNVIRDYGHSESAMVHQNIAIIIAALLCHEQDFTGAVMAAVNCGFDTDCTGATVGAVLGILRGGDEVSRECGVTDAEYKLGVRSPRTDFRVRTLAADVCALARRFAADTDGESGVTVTQEGTPAVGFGETCEIVLRLRAAAPLPAAQVTLSVKPPAVLEQSKFTLALCPEAVIRVRAHVPAEERILPEAMPGEILLDGKPVGRFGLSGKRRWRVFGPFWKNNVSVPPLAAGESYWKYIRGEGDAFYDELRRFHISCLPDESVNIDALLQNGGDAKSVTVDTCEDVVRLGDCTGFCGNSAYLFVTDFLVDEAGKADLQIGRNTPMRVWLNGTLLAERDGNEMFYHESIHKLGVSLMKGKNTLAFWIVKNNEDTRFSYQFLQAGVCSDHIMYPIVNNKEEKSVDR